jgi:hypothetical protein
MKYVFHFLWTIVFLFFSIIGMIAIVQSPTEAGGYIALAACAYFAVGFHKLILAHYPKQTYFYVADNKSFWLGWVLMLLPCIAFWRAYQVLATHAYEQDLSKTRRGWAFDAMTNWLGDTFGHGAPAIVYLVMGLLFLAMCIKLMRER